MTTSIGAICWIRRCMVARRASTPSVVCRSQWKCSRPASTQRARSRPTEAMLRRISAGDSSKLKKSTLSPRSQAALAKLAASVVLPVPAVPLIRMLLPRRQPALRDLVEAVDPRQALGQHDSCRATSACNVGTCLLYTSDAADDLLCVD